MYNNLIIPARARGSWESIDLGIALAKKEYWPLFKLFFIPSILISLIAFLIIPEGYIWSITLLIWWLKPLFERTQLYYLSRTFFGEKVSRREIFNQIPSLLKNGLLYRLTLARFSTGRSFYMPIRVLEQQSGQAYTQRRDVLSYNEGTHNWLSIIGIHIETILAYSALILIIFLLPDSFGLDSLDSFIESSVANNILNLCTILMFSAFAPFYVASGFMLYLNRRIKLEGWDIEIAFKGIVSRLSQERKVSRIKENEPDKKNLAATHITNLILCCFLFFTVTHQYNIVTAQEPSETATETLTSEQAAADIQAIYDSEEVQITETVNGWEAKNSLEPVSKDSSLSNKTLELISKAFRFFAVVVIVSVLLYLVYFYRDVFGTIKPTKRKTQAGTKSLSPIAKRLNNLPDDYISAAKLAWSKDDYRQAMSLIYRGALSSTLKRGCNNILEASTENECLSIVKKFEHGKYSTVLKQVTREWQLTAYANRTTDKETFLDLITSIEATFFDTLNTTAKEVVLT